MRWIKRGLIYCTSGEYEWSKTHAQIPTPIMVSKEKARIFFCTRGDQNQSQPTFIDLDMNDFSIIHINDKPLLSFGQNGTFDDSGIMPTCVLRKEDKILMYYTGWNSRVTSPYGLGLGLAISEDNGDTFYKYSDGPILDRSITDPIFTTTCSVIRDIDIFRMYYVSCTEWRNVKGRLEPQYLAKYAESSDGIHWIPSGRVCIDYKYDGEAICRPWAIKDCDRYKMWYSTRGSVDYRMNGGQHYVIGYAESSDGLNWVRKDDLVGITTSKEGWDSEMIEYCSILDCHGERYMFYNGNGFGKSGFGYAVCESGKVI
jgi:hypothetical protein